MFIPFSLASITLFLTQSDDAKPTGCELRSDISTNYNIHHFNSTSPIHTKTGSNQIPAIPSSPSMGEAQGPEERRKAIPPLLDINHSSFEVRLESFSLLRLKAILASRECISISLTPPPRKVPEREELPVTLSFREKMKNLRNHFSSARNRAKIKYEAI